jgi:hypothetical protein
MNTETIETIDLVELVRRRYVRLDNNLSMKEKNKHRRKIKAKKIAVRELFVSTLTDLLWERM